MRVAYTIAQKHEAVALAVVVGAEAAADQLGIDVRSVRKWAEAAGHRPELEVDDWQALHDLAVARTTAAVASGKLPARTVAVIAGIAARNLRPTRVVAPSEPDEPAENPGIVAMREALEWLDTLPDGAGSVVKRWLRRHIDDELQDRRDSADQRAIDDDPYADPEPDQESSPEWWAGWREYVAANLPAILDEQAAAEALEAARWEQRDKASRWLSDDEADLLAEAERELASLEEELSA